MLFRNSESTQFVIVTIPTVMAVAESARLAKALKAESVPVKTLVVNQVCQITVIAPMQVLHSQHELCSWLFALSVQVVQQAAAQNFLDQRRKDQSKALQLLHDSPSLRCVLVVTISLSAWQITALHNDLSKAMCRELELTEGPLVDLEVRGVPALQYFGRQIWL